jgi:hypothetical protein
VVVMVVDSGTVAVVMQDHQVDLEVDMARLSLGGREGPSVVLKKRTAGGHQPNLFILQRAALPGSSRPIAHYQSKPLGFLQ